MSASPWLVATIALAACPGGRVSRPTRPPAEFCAAVVAGDLDAAEASTYSAMLEVGAERLADASEPLAAWLRAQPCVTTVDVPTIVIETEPGIREITFQLRPDAENVTRSCVADLRLAVGAEVGIHPAHHVTTNPDTRCSALSAR